MHLITGYAGSAHITSADQGAFNAGLVGTGDFVMSTGRQFAAEIVSNNKIRINDGDAVMQGRHFNISNGQYEEVTILNGTQGMKRYDLIVARYTKDTGTGTEGVGLYVLQGVSSNATPTQPTPTTGNILEGDTLHEMPLFRVYLNGLNVESVTPLFNVVSPFGSALSSKLTLTGIDENDVEHTWTVYGEVVR